MPSRLNPKRSTNYRLNGARSNARIKEVMKLYKANGFALKSVLVLILIVLASCSKQASKDRSLTVIGDSESYPIGNSKLKNCHFKFPTPTYTFGATIEPNLIQCDEGVATMVQILTPAPLPS